MGLFEIQLSGRIPKYFFGTLREEFREEIKEAVELFDEVEDENEFLNLIYSLSLDGGNVEDLFEKISKEDLEKLPNFNRIVNEFIDEEPGHLLMLEWLFDFPNMRTHGSYYGISLFEDDATVTILNNSTDETILEETRLSEFMEGESITLESCEVEEGQERYNEVVKIREMITANPEFGFYNDGEYFTWNTNDSGCKFLSTEITYPDMTEFEKNNNREYSVTVYFDDITTWSFMIETEEDEIDMSKLTFVNYSGSEEFRSSNVVFNHLFYGNDLLEMEENWHRDKGVDLKYGDNRRFDTLEFFLYQ